MEFKKYFLDKAEIVPLNGYVKGINFIFNFIEAWWLYIKKKYASWDYQKPNRKNFGSCAICDRISN